MSWAGNSFRQPQVLLYLDTQGWCLQADVQEASTYRQGRWERTVQWCDCTDIADALSAAGLDLALTPLRRGQLDVRLSADLAPGFLMEPALLQSLGRAELRQASLALLPSSAVSGCGFDDLRWQQASPHGARRAVFTACPRALVDALKVLARRNYLELRGVQPGWLDLATQLDAGDALALLEAGVLTCLAADAQGHATCLQQLAACDAQLDQRLQQWLLERNEPMRCWRVAKAAGDATTRRGMARLLEEMFP